MIDEEQLQSILSKLDTDQRALFAEASMGEIAKDFVASPIGEYLIGCAMQEIALGHQKLKTVSPWRRRRIRDIQNEIWRGEKFIEWLRDLVIAGAQAGQTLEREEADGHES